MTATDLAAFGAAAVGTIAALIVWLPWVKGAINARAFTDQIIKLMLAGNADRAKKLCAVAPDAPFIAGTRAAIDGLHTASSDPAEATAQLREIFRNEVKAKVAARSASTLIVAVALAGVATGVALSFDGARGAAGLGALGALFLILAYAAARKLATNAVVEGDRLVDGLVRSRH